MTTRSKPRASSPTTKAIRLSAGGLDQLHEVAQTKGTTPRAYLEALMRLAISQWGRPGTWEAQGFDYTNDIADGCADRWF